MVTAQTVFRTMPEVRKSVSARGLLPSGAVIALGAVLAVAAGAQTAGLVLAKSAPVLATQISPISASANENIARSLERAALAPAGTAQPVSSELRGRAEGYAIRAARYDPLAVDAQAVLATRLPVEARLKAVLASNVLSRRSSLLNSALLEEYRRTGDIAGVLRVLDTTLQIRPGLAPQIMPLMVQLLKQPGSVRVFGEILSQHPEWVNAFLQRAAADRSVADKMVALRTILHRGSTITLETDRDIMSALIKAGRLADAARIYKLVRPDGDSAVSGSADSLSWRNDLPPLDWKFADERGLYARNSARDPDLKISVRPGFGGQLAERSLALGDGVRGLLLEHDLQPTDSLSSLSLKVTCLTNGQTLAKSDFGPSPMRLQFRASGQNCPIARIVIDGRVWSDGRRVSGTIAPIKVIR
ncbi:hypothetical protein F7D01_13550 [Erythrobacter sp. 3-20A1M]|uniref:hypothetical protein n=1 Tax=Erythrobacter sp. 3-20A1M TaxID=2653850 RepID=UPI001BFC040E|nr:hypothetical protein [Erythrobacter sp. 3-20A1M]QWC57947.1 hypothetical protein F7D01_13550 [Erythrobacter sp. 3-20A1M]